MIILKARAALAVSVAAGVALSAVSASAATEDLFTSGDVFADGTDATFTAIDFIPTAGTGVIQPFLGLQASPTERGYNSDLSTPEFDETRSGSAFVRSVQLSDMLIDDAGYYTFFGDWNEPNGQGQDTLSILTWDLYLDSNGLNNLEGTGEFMADRLVYSLGTQINTVDFGGGSGQQDMEIKIDASLFDIEGYDGEFMMLYTVLGWNCRTLMLRDRTVCETVTYETSGGFEEFSVVFGENDGPPPPPPPPPPMIPLPAAGWLLLGGLGSLVALRRKS